MSDLIDREEALKAITFGALSAATIYGRTEEGMTASKETIRVIKALPSAEPKIIHCKDCRWWEGTNGKKGYCHAAKHGYYSSSWEIHIYRTHYGEFYCADAERRTDE